MGMYPGPRTRRRTGPVRRAPELVLGFEALRVAVFLRIFELLGIWAVGRLFVVALF